MEDPATITLRHMTDTSNFNQTIIDEFRANGGQVGGGFAGAPIVIITTKGAKSGQARVNPLVALPEDDGTLYIFASKGGAPSNPDWYYNIVAHPELEVEYGADKFQAIGTVLTGAKRDEIFDRQKKLMPGFADYEKGTSRIIPVVALTRKDA
jgi:deazaflavin-dependent oxidoreductase (nitroreductase family)